MERMQLIALGSHRIADRFAHDDTAFGKRIKDTATALLEDVALYGVAKKRDAVGTNRLCHSILGRLEALHALLTFAKNRGLLQPATVDIVLWQVIQLLAYFQQEDGKVEQHIAEHHSQGAIISASPVPEPAPIFTKQPAASTQSLQPLKPLSLSGFDPLLGPDSAVAQTPQRPLNPPTATMAAIGFGGGRQRRILDFFTLRRRAPLKEVLQLFPDVSEKTIRNDLSLLCQQGQLRRVGLAPRSHYILSA